MEEKAEICARTHVWCGLIIGKRGIPRRLTPPVKLVQDGFMKQFFLMCRWMLAMAAVALVTPVISARADDPPGFHRMEIGEAAPDFKLPGIDGKDWTLADFKSADVLMVYFTSNHCPVCHAHDPRLLALLKELKGRSLSVVAINPNSP